MIFKKRNLNYLNDILSKLKHKSIFVPYATDCSFEIMLQNIENVTLNYNNKNIALMWSQVINNLDLFVDTLGVVSNDTTESLNYEMLNSRNPSTKSASCFKLMYQTT